MTHTTGILSSSPYGEEYGRYVGTPYVYGGGPGVRSKLKGVKGTLKRRCWKVLCRYVCAECVGTYKAKKMRSELLCT